MADDLYIEQTYVDFNSNPQLIVSGEYIDAGLIEEIYQDLDGCISHEEIQRIAYEVAASFHDAIIETFIPIFIRRNIKERFG